MATELKWLASIPSAPFTNCFIDTLSAHTRSSNLSSVTLKAVKRRETVVSAPATRLVFNALNYHGRLCAPTV